MKDGVKTILTNWRTHLMWALVLSLIIIPLVVAFTYMTVHQGDASKPYVPKLKSIADQMPVYPGFERIGEDSIVLKQGMASLHRSFRADAQFAEVRKFYDAGLARDGWGPPEVPPPSIFIGEEPHYVTYRRGTYEIHVARTDGGPDVYVFTFIWYSQ